MNIRLAGQILADKPFEAPHGKTGEEWKKSAHFLSKAVDPQDTNKGPHGFHEEARIRSSNEGWV
jgi:hypothetical protein